MISSVEIRGDRQADVLLDPFSRARLKDKFQGFCFAIRTAVPMRLVMTQMVSRTTVGTFVELTAEVRGVGVWRGVCLCEYLGV